MLEVGAGGVDGGGFIDPVGLDARGAPGGGLADGEAQGVAGGGDLVGAGEE